MTKFKLHSRIFLFTITAFGGLSCFVQSPDQNILIVIGGHDFERETFFKVFDDMPDIEYKEVIQPEANNMFLILQIDTYDVLLFYDMVEEISTLQKQAISWIQLNP